MATSHPDFIPIKMETFIEGESEPRIVQVAGNDKIEFKIPGGVKYYTKFYFQVKNRKLENLLYKQIVKKGGVTIRSREIPLGSYEPSDEIHTIDFPEDETPGGWLMRATYYATSTYSAGDEILIVNDWTLEITK
ncbi:hypothetical protein KGF54_002054 [Candida jiufengensis]|uniref:uncharacterized protein n=1 Tax=Candida jiufengensis TaxID=497108 RepID=UPI002224436A|nr:uncharacterized protein KGF54_002054 [Candida jiufengensis]KAI5954279.1 hypothetical protein KGF54_002054 [Candida jiufengensis]